MPQIPLAASASYRTSIGMPEKLCRNVYQEPHLADPQRMMSLVETPGTLAQRTYASGVRGLAQADGHAGGKLLIATGNTVATLDTVTGVIGSLGGTIAGTDRVTSTFAETEGALLAGGVIHVSDGTRVQSVADGLTSSPALVAGTSQVYVAHGAFTYTIERVNYSKAANPGGILPVAVSVPQGKYGAQALDIDASGVVFVVVAPNNATGYATAIAASSALPPVAVDRVRLGWVTASKSDAAFVFGTTGFGAANVTAEFVNTDLAESDWQALLDDHGQAGFTSMATMGQRLLVTYGSRFAFSDTLDFGATTAINYYTAESSPDGLVAGVVLGATYFLFGTRTIEPWQISGDSNDPFSWQGVTIQVGCLCRDSIVTLDQTLVFVANDRTVRRLAGGYSAPIISQPWITRALQDADPTSIIAWGYEEDGHSFYVLRTPDGCYCYDAMTGEWHTRSSWNSETLRWVHAASVGGRVFVGDESGNLDRMSRLYSTERKPDLATDGDAIIREWTAYLPTSSGRPEVASVRLDGSKGVGQDTGQGVDPHVSMAISVDNGNTFSPWRQRGLGRRGEYDRRTIWRRCGRSKAPGMALRFRKSDPAPLVVTGLWVNEDL